MPFGSFGLPSGGKRVSSLDRSFLSDSGTLSPLPPHTTALSITCSHVICSLKFNNKSAFFGIARFQGFLKLMSKGAEKTSLASWAAEAANIQALAASKSKGLIWYWLPNLKAFKIGRLSPFTMHVGHTDYDCSDFLWSMWCALCFAKLPQ